MKKSEIEYTRHLVLYAVRGREKREIAVGHDINVINSRKWSNKFWQKKNQFVISAVIRNELMSVLCSINNKSHTRARTERALKIEINRKIIIFPFLFVRRFRTGR